MSEGEIEGVGEGGLIEREKRRWCVRLCFCAVLLEGVRVRVLCPFLDIGPLVITWRH